MPGPSSLQDKALFEAIKRKSAQEASGALARGANPNLHDLFGVPVLQMALRFENFSCANALLTRGAKPDELSRDGISSLRMCCVEGRTAALTLLLTHPCDLRQIDGAGDSLLHTAAARGKQGLAYREAAGLLLKKGAHPGAKNARGETPLHHASRFGGKNMAQVFIQAKSSDLRERDVDGQTPLHAAALGLDNLETIRFLLASGAGPDERDRNGCGPLHLIASKTRVKDFDVECARALISAGADLRLKDADGLNPWERSLWGKQSGRDIPSALIDLLNPLNPAKSRPNSFIAPAGVVAQAPNPSHPTPSAAPNRSGYPAAPQAQGAPTTGASPAPAAPPQSAPVPWPKNFSGKKVSGKKRGSGKSKGSWSK